GSEPLPFNWGSLLLAELLSRYSLEFRSAYELCMGAQREREDRDSRRRWILLRSDRPATDFRFAPFQWQHPQTLHRGFTRLSRQLGPACEGSHQHRDARPAPADSLYDSVRDRNRT